MSCEIWIQGRDIRGIFRVHQFEKIEQFVLSDPEKQLVSDSCWVENMGVQLGWEDHKS